MNYEYIVFGPSSSLSHSSPPQCIACATALISNKIHAIAHPAAGSMSHDAVRGDGDHCKCGAATLAGCTVAAGGSMSHNAVNTSPHTH